ncbi:hypothetical protein Tcan_12589 [Toxocara canis]|uniref:Uncharacterized protein n=1 Tax=Toxocara canis TaxID=6265 RepID=A0A0B2V1Z4_TOXCA|nr:hypothetical protein Tcan_12589 [Toxocara canis]
MPISCPHIQATASRSNSSCRRLLNRPRHSSKNNDSYNNGVLSSRARNWKGSRKLRDPMLQEAKEIILQLKAKLEERHQVATKIVDLDKTLQRINESSDEVLVEMENRIDDLNRDWQRRIRNENSKWQQRFEDLRKYMNGKEIICTLTADPMWRIERRLLAIETQLKPIEQIDKNVLTIAEVFNATNKRTPKKRNDDDLRTARLKASACRACATRRPSLYGVVEMTETYSMCVRNLERAIKSLSEISKMPAVIGNTPNGVSSISEVDRTARLLTDFVRKLKISLRESHFTGSPDEPEWDE